jgi:UDP-2,4-diacetamido-2,4,6-trideoxy-beta-L-altropyranose hydrolase
MQNILFRANSSSTIGTGHIMRDLVLAEQFKDVKIIFATQSLPGNINHKIKERNYVIEIINSNDLEELVGIIKKHSIDMIVIDHYGIDYGFERSLKEITGITVFVIDDTYEKHCCDILLNHNVYGDSTKYKGLVPETCEVRCGSTYTLLRNEFIKEKQKGRQCKNNDKQLNAFISMGSSDHTNISIKILEVLKEFSNIYAHVVTTTANKNLKELENYVSSRNNISLHINSNSIAQLMNNANFAIVTPSVTLNEILYLGIPFIAIQTAVNQKHMFKFIKKLNLKILKEFTTDELKYNIEGFN